MFTGELLRPFHLSHHQRVDSRLPVVVRRVPVRAIWILEVSSTRALLAITGQSVESLEASWNTCADPAHFVRVAAEGELSEPGALEARAVFCVWRVQDDGVVSLCDVRGCVTLTEGNTSATLLDLGAFARDGLSQHTRCEIDWASIGQLIPALDSGWNTPTIFVDQSFTEAGPSRLPAELALGITERFED